MYKKMSRMRLIMILRATRDEPFDSLYQVFGRENGTSKEASLGSSCEFFMDDILQRMKSLGRLTVGQISWHYVTFSVTASHLSPIQEKMRTPRK